MEYDSRIKDALVKMNFVEKYENLVKTFSEVRTPAEEMLEYIDGEEVLEMIRELGYVPKFISKEKFFKTNDEKLGNFSFRVHIILRYGIAEFLWIVSEGKEVIWGYPFDICPRILISPDYQLSKPVFGTYEDLDEILKITFEMYEDLKKAFIEVCE